MVRFDAIPTEVVLSPGLVVIFRVCPEGRHDAPQIVCVLAAQVLLNNLKARGDDVGRGGRHLVTEH